MFGNAALAKISLWCLKMLTCCPREFIADARNGALAKLIFVRYGDKHIRLT